MSGLRESAVANNALAALPKAPTEEAALLALLRTGVWLCAALVAFIAISAFAGVRLTTVDDMNWALQAWGGQWWQAALHDATVHGRLIRPSHAATYVPYLIDNMYYYAAMRFGALFAAVAAATWVLRLLVRDPLVPALFCLLFFAFTLNSWHHHIDSSYPFVWHALWTSYLVSLGLLIVAIRRRRVVLAWFGAAIYVLGLHEPFVPCVVIHLLIAWRHAPGWRANRRYVMPYLVLLALWLALWFAWRWLHPSTYPGSQLAPVFSPVAIAKTIAMFSLGGFPLMDVFVGPSRLSTADLSIAGVTLWLVKAAAVLLATAMLWRLARATDGARPVSLDRGVAAALILLAVLVIAPIGFTPKYQIMASTGVHHYIYSQLAYFAWVGLLALCIAYVLRRWRSALAAAGLALLCAAGSFAADWGSAVTNHEQRLSTLKWSLIDRWLGSEAFATVPDGATIYVEGLNQPRGIAATDDRYWRLYIEERGGKRVGVVDSADALIASKAPRYALAYVEEANGSDQYLLFAPLENDVSLQSLLPTRHAIVIANGSAQSIMLGGALDDRGAACGSAVVANRVTALGSDRGVFSGEVALLPDARGVSVATLDLSQAVDVRSLWASFARSRDAPTSLAIDLGKGFYAWESADGLTRSVWSSGTSTLRAINRTAVPVAIVFKAGFSSLDAQKVTLDVDGEPPFSIDLPSGLARVDRSIPIELLPGVTDISLHGSAAARRPGNGDPRLLSFQLVAPELACATTP